MALSYPLAFPTATGVAKVTMRAVNVVGFSESPFSLAQQTVRHSGQRWGARIELPLMRQADAKTWRAFLLSLKGQWGTFLMGEPGYVGPAGGATSGTVTGAAGAEAVTVSLSGGSLNPGDRFQLGSGSSARLYEVLQVVGSTADIFPALRAAASGASMTLSSPQGVWRLAAPNVDWTNDVGTFGVSFEAMEAL